MNSYSFAHLSDAALIREFRTSLLQVREGTALLLAQIAEIDARRLFAPAGFSSMFLYCVREFHFSEDAAWRRIQAARAARRFPALFGAIKDGRLHLTAVCLIAPHIKPENADELIHAATHLSRAEIQAWLARRFPQALPPPTRERIRLVSPAPARVKQETTVLFGRHVEPVAELAAPSPLIETALAARTPPTGSAPDLAGFDASRSTPHLAGVDSSPGTPAPPSSFMADSFAGGSRCQNPEAPSTPPRYLVQVTISGDTHEKLQHARALLSHVVGTDVAQVIDRALDALIERLESKKAGFRKKPETQSEGTREAGIDAQSAARPESGQSLNPKADGAAGERVNPNRYIPRAVRRAVWNRDGGRCTFVSPEGQRCGEKWFLEFDHVLPVAQGGTATLEGLRLRCRAHNQLEADRALGSEFMRRKRDNGRAKATTGKAQATTGKAQATRDSETEGPRRENDTMTTGTPDPAEGATLPSSRAPT